MKLSSSIQTIKSGLGKVEGAVVQEVEGAVKWVGDNTKTARNVILTAGVGGATGVIAKLQGAVGAAWDTSMNGIPTPIPSATEIPSQIIDVVDAVAPAAGSNLPLVAGLTVIAASLLGGGLVLGNHLRSRAANTNNNLINAAQAQAQEK